MPKVVIQDGVLCFDAGSVKLDCGCAPSTPECCIRPGGSTLYLPPVDPAFPNPISGSIQVQAGGTGDFVAWTTALQDFVGGETEARLALTSNRWSVDHTHAIDSLLVSLQTIANGCIAGFSVSEVFFPNGEPTGTPVGAYDGQYLILDTIGGITDTIPLTGEPMYLRSATLSALHPAWTGLPASPGVPRWSLDLVYQTAFVPWATSYALLPTVAMHFEFGDYCQVNAAQSKLISVPSLTLPTFVPPLVGPYNRTDSTAALDPSTAVSPLTTASQIGGGDSLRWAINANASERVNAVNAFGVAARAVYSASSRITIAMQHQSASSSTTSFAVCPDFIPLVEPCNPTGANACCEGDADCGKVDPLAPYRWRRVRQAVGSIEDMDPAGVQQTAPGWIVVPTPVDDIVAMQPGTADCDVSLATINTSQGSAINTDRLGTSRIAILSSTVAQVNGQQILSRALVEPAAGSAPAKRWRLSITQPVRWITSQPQAADVIMGVLRIVGETPGTLPPAGAGVELAITQAEFEWTNLPINPTTGYNGFTLDASVNPNPIEDLTANVAGFAYLATFGPGGCLRAAQLVPQIGAGLPGILCDTTRFGWMTDSTTVATPQTRRKIRIRYNAAPYFELLNIGQCPSGAAAITEGCVGCGSSGGLT